MNEENAGASEKLNEQINDGNGKCMEWLRVCANELDWDRMKEVEQNAQTR